MPPEDYAAFERGLLAHFTEPAYGPADIAKATGTSRWTVDRAIRNGSLPAFRFGTQKLCVLRHDLIAWLWSRRAVRPEPVDASPPPKQVQRPKRGRPPKGGNRRAGAAA